MVALLIPKSDITECLSASHSATEDVIKHWRSLKQPLRAVRDA